MFGRGTSGAPACPETPAEAASHPARSVPPSARLWLVLVTAMVASFYLHELGHCAVAWVHGYAAVPTPLKEYISQPLPPAVGSAVSLGGIGGSVTALLLALACFLRRPDSARSAILAGAMTAPGFYSLRFLLAGRGHDATEFQEAQAALGLAYSGHALDWVFLALFLGAAAVWFWRLRPPVTLRLAGRLAAGAFAALVALVVLQSVNNAVFDPLFEPERPRADK